MYCSPHYSKTNDSHDREREQTTLISVLCQKLGPKVAQTINVVGVSLASDELSINQSQPDSYSKAFVQFSAITSDDGPVLKLLIYKQTGEDCVFRKTFSLEDLTSVTLDIDEDGGPSIMEVSLKQEAEQDSIYFSGFAVQIAPAHTSIVAECTVLVFEAHLCSRRCSGVAQP
jgi:hypothetical protein